MKTLTLGVLLFLTVALNAQYFLTDTQTDSTYSQGKYSRIVSAGHYDDNDNSGTTQSIDVQCFIDEDSGFLNRQSYIYIAVVEVGGETFPDINDEIRFDFNDSTVTYTLENYDAESSSWAIFIYDYDSAEGTNNIYSRELYEDILEEFINHGEFEIEITSLEDDEDYGLTIQAFPWPHKTKEVSNVVRFCYQTRMIDEESDQTDSFSTIRESSQSDASYLNDTVDVIQDIQRIKESPRSAELLQTIKTLLRDI